MIQAQGYNILVQIPAKQASMKGSLYIPEGTSQGNQVVSATVVSVGAAVGIGQWNGQSVPSNVVAGATVWFQKPNSVEFEADGEKYQIVPENAILAVSI